MALSTVRYPHQHENESRTGERPPRRGNRFEDKRRDKLGREDRRKDAAGPRGTILACAKKERGEDGLDRQWEAGYSSRLEFRRPRSTRRWPTRAIVAVLGLVKATPTPTDARTSAASRLEMMRVVRGPPKSL